jgi:hypothetical protein
MKISFELSMLKFYTLKPLHFAQTVWIRQPFPATARQFWGPGAIVQPGATHLYSEKHREFLSAVSGRFCIVPTRGGSNAPGESDLATEISVMGQAADIFPPVNSMLRAFLADTLL